MAVLEGARTDGIERVVRINGLRTVFGIKDLQAVADHPSPPDAIMLPKVEAAEDTVVAALLQAGGQRLESARSSTLNSGGVD